MWTLKVPGVWRIVAGKDANACRGRSCHSRLDIQHDVHYMFSLSRTARRELARYGKSGVHKSTFNSEPPGNRRKLDPRRRTQETMMRLKVREIGGALHPSEVVVEIRTATRPERLAIDRKSLQHGTIFVG